MNKGAGWHYNGYSLSGNEMGYEYTWSRVVKWTHFGNAEYVYSVLGAPASGVLGGEPVHRLPCRHDPGHRLLLLLLFPTVPNPTHTAIHSP